MSLSAEGTPDREWKRRAKAQIDPLLNGYVFPTLSADPANIRAGYTYFNSTSNKLRCFDGTVFNNLW